MKLIAAGPHIRSCTFDRVFLFVAIIGGPTCVNRIADVAFFGEITERKVNGEDRVATYAPTGKLPLIVDAFEKAKTASSKAEIVALINDFDLPREAIPTQWLNEVAGWDALLKRMPITALVRYLG